MMLLYGRTYSKSMDQPGKAANPALLVVSSTAGKMNMSLSAFAPKNLVSRDGFGSPLPRQPAHPHTPNLALTYRIPPESRGGVHL